MKRWAALVVGLYALVMLALVLPVLMLSWGVRLDEVARLFAREPGPWVVVGIYVLLFGGCQLLLLLVPVRATGGRPVPRRRLIVPAITVALLAALLLGSGVFAVGLAIFGEHDEALFFIGAALALLVAGWAFWSYIFYIKARDREPVAAVNRMARWLLAGSILELLVAVPTHIVVRCRHDCCAPIGTFWGITCGLAVALLSFGPALFLLFADRARRITPTLPPATETPQAQC
ncbi:MAG: hypothetical protein LLG01_06770 [Planctomycetaceae bacterium]|nr:hypothetical protein [Planctomycetaceae bacterium]